MTMARPVPRNRVTHLPLPSHLSQLGHLTGGVTEGGAVPSVDSFDSRQEIVDLEATLGVANDEAVARIATNRSARSILTRVIIVLNQACYLNY